MPTIPDSPGMRGGVPQEGAEPAKARQSGKTSGGKKAEVNPSMPAAGKAKAVGTAALSQSGGQVAEVGSLRGSSAAVALEPKGSGMDKVFYLPPAPDDGSTHFGFLDCSDSVKEAELQAYHNLSDATAGTGVKVPKVINDAEQPAPVVVKKKGGKVEQGSGYWIQVIPNMKNFKPLMAAGGPLFAASAGGQNNPVKIFNSLKRAGKMDEARQMKADMQAIYNNVDTICGLVGEVCLGIDKENGDVFLFDVAPTQGQTAESQADRVGVGLSNLIDAMKLP